jgi:deoxyribodipyrimidine photo-lyase
MKLAYKKIKWHKNERYLNAWKEGKTGVPVVDAGMRQMNMTGYMHNRARLIVASFLVKTLLINWREGEHYFATKLTDYDVASNNGNWQWVAGTGADSMPYFRIFNPWRQAEEMDPDCKYIKTWIPELRDVPEKDIFNWSNKWYEYKKLQYPKPIIDFKEQTEEAMKMYQAVYK